MPIQPPGRLAPLRQQALAEIAIEWLESHDIAFTRSSDMGNKV